VELTAGHFARLFGVAERDLPKACTDAIVAADLRYEQPTAAARDGIILRVLQTLDSDKPTVVGAHRSDIWESCWADSLQRFRDAGLSPESLVPHFITPGLPVRLGRDYAIPASPRYELRVLEVCRAFLFDRYFAQMRSIYEFGCGSGFNLVALARQLPGKKLLGLDWSKSSNETVSLIRKALDIDVTGRHFDFFAPDRSLALGRDCGVLTMCALEQVGARHDAFLSYLLDAEPGVCVHMEPLLELYEDSHLVDYLAVRYHRKRGYLQGFLPALRALESSGRIELLDVRRFHFGSFYHEGYSYVAWRPR
jgi:SAM-dependent methyltransferase